MRIKKPELDNKTIEQAKRMLTAITAMAVLVAMGFAAKPMLDRQMERIGQAVPVSAVDEGTYESAEQSIATFRDERARNRSVTVAQLNAIIDDADTDDATRREAQQALMVSMQRSEQETNIEGVVTALGFDGCVASVGAKSCTVIVRSETLSRQQAAQILDAACRETGMLSGDIKVIPVE